MIKRKTVNSVENIEKLEIFYVRHADTSGASCGDRDKCDIDLSELGEIQAKLVGERFAGRQFDAVFSSPLVRVVKTAAAVAEKLSDKPEIEIMPELVECGTTYGYLGQNPDYLKKYYDNLTLCKDRIYSDENGFFSTDSDEENYKRAKSVINYFRKRFTYGQKIIVFSHGSFGNSLLPASVDAGVIEFILSINNTSVSKIKYTTDGKERISFQNDFSHLRSIMPDYEFDV